MHEPTLHAAWAPGGEGWGAVHRWCEVADASHPPDAALAQLAGSRAGQSPTARVEAALWHAAEPLGLRKLARVAGLPRLAAVREAIDRLRVSFRRRRAALEIVEVGGGVRLVTRPVYQAWIDRARLADELPATAVKIGRSAEETLAIVAHRQPALRSEVEAIRGVGSGDALRQLLDADLLRIVGRSEELGRPLLYGTTDRFLELYGLRSLADLPAGGEGADRSGPT